MSARITVPATAAERGCVLGQEPAAGGGIEILSRMLKPRQIEDAETGRHRKPVPARHGRGQPFDNGILKCADPARALQMICHAEAVSSPIGRTVTTPTSNDIGMSRRMVDHHVRFNDRMVIAPDGRKHLKTGDVTRDRRHTTTALYRAALPADL